MEHSISSPTMKQSVSQTIVNDDVTYESDNKEDLTPWTPNDY